MNDFTFADIFSLSMSPLQVIVTLLMALIVGGFICFVCIRATSTLALSCLQW